MPAPITRNLTILLTDIKGFTDKTSNKSRSQIQEMLDRHRDTVLPVLQSRGGKLVKTIGDAFLMVFESPTDAVLAGVAVQDALARFNEGNADADRLDVRIAINTGEVNLAENDIFGEPVNITARIEGVAQAGEVFFTEAVYLAMNKTEVPSSEVGQLQLKGIREKVRVYKVKREQPVEGVEGASTDPHAVKPLWERLRQVPAGPTNHDASGPAPKARIVGRFSSPPLWRRSGALLIDLVICGIIAGVLRGGDHEQIGVKYDAKKSKSSSALKVDDSGIHGKIGSSKISIDDNGIEITNPKKQEAGTTLELPEKPAKDYQVSLSGRGVTVEPVKKNGEVIVESGPLTVTKKRSSRNFLFPIIWFIYSIVFLKRMSATPGKRILRLAVVSGDGSPIERKTAFYRAAFSLISGYAAGLGFLWGVFERDRRTWHDLVAGTRVVLVDG